MAQHYEYIRPTNFPKDAELTKRDIWRGLKENTTVHGIPNLTRARGTVKKAFWAITICLTVGAFFYNVSAIAMIFADFPVSVSITLLHENELIFPAVTICNMSPVRKSAMESSAAFDEEAQQRKKRRKRRKRSSGGSGYYCESGWHIYNQHCYWASTATKRQSNALDLCQDLGANLASILDQNEQDFVESISTDVDGSQYWVGLYNYGGNNWKWTDGQVLSYLNWESSEPNDSGLCGRLAENGLWRDMTCSSKYKFVCKTRAMEITTMSPTTEAETTRAATTPEITTQPDTTVPDTTVAYTTQSDTTQPDTTLADTTQPDTTVADTTLADTTQPDTTVADTTLADTTQPDTALADTTQPDTTVADTTLADTTQPDTTVADTTLADTTQPETTLADTTQPDTTVADTTLADTTQPDTALADTTQPDTMLADTTQPDTTVADTTVTETTVSDTTVADTTDPDSTVAGATQVDTITADTTLPDTTIVDTTAAETTGTYTTVADATQSGTTTTDSTQRDTTVLSTTLPETTIADTTSSDTTQPDKTAQKTKAITSSDSTQPASTASDAARLATTLHEITIGEATFTFPATTLEDAETTEPPTTTAPLQSSCCCTCCFESDYYTGRQVCSTCADHTVEDAATCATNKYTESTPAPVPTSAYDISDEPDPQPLEGSKFPERVETRESYKEEEKFTEVLANVNASEKYNLGFKAEDLILDCQYAGYDCYLSDFETFYNPVHGNCYIFNSGWNSSDSLKRSHRAGRRHGLHMILNIDQDEYVKEVGDTAGLRMVVHPQNRMPFPEDEGITVPAGHATSIGIRQVVIQREPHPYGSCRDPEHIDYYSNVFEELYPVGYSTTSCIKTCYQQYVISRCGCADPQIPMFGSAFGNTNVRACDSSDIEQDDCKYEVTTLYNENKLPCNCPSSCRDVDFQLDLSSGVWPSNVQKTDVLKKLAPKIGYLFDDPSNPERYKENLIKMEIYYEEFNFERIKETPSYPPQNFLSDLGGVLGLWLGMSVLTIFEYVEFFIDIMIFCCVNKFGKNRVKSLGNILSPQLSEAPVKNLDLVSGSSNCLVNGSSAMKTENMSRLRSGRSFSIAGEKESGSHTDDISEHSCEAMSSPLQARQDGTRGHTMSSQSVESPVDFSPDRRGLSMPYYNMKLNRERMSAALSSRDVALYDRDSPVEMRGLSPPPPYSSRRGSETSNSSKCSGRSSQNSQKMAWQSLAGETKEQEPPCARESSTPDIDQDYLLSI